MSIGIIIQARVGSTRLPNKIILPIEREFTFLDLLLSKIKKNFPTIPIILATSKNEENEILKKYAEKNKVVFFKGEENNVLKRFIDCAENYQLKSIIRICSDNPFLDIQLLKNLIDNYEDEDYFSYKVNSNPSILTHYGFFAEIVSLNALKKVQKNKKGECLEHVTNCIYTNKTGDFRINFIEKKIDNNYIRCTLDTLQDFKNLKEIYFNWYKKTSDNSYKSLLEYISKNKELKELMKKEILRNSK